MPFKTRKKKLAAEKHRVVFDKSGVVSYFDADKGAGDGRTKAPRARQDELSSEVDSKKVKGELSRILLLATLIIGLQLALRLSNLPLFK